MQGDRDIMPSLITKNLIPENKETPIHFLDHWTTPLEYFFIRNHFPYPHLTNQCYHLPITGEVKRPISLGYDEILEMPAKSMLIPLECSGNKRAFFKPKVYGEQWQDGAISQGLWTGVPLCELLLKAGVKENAREVVFEGSDIGKRPDSDGIFSFARSLPLNKALHPDTIIAYKLNNTQLPFKHGYPLRLIVPDWYGMAWVKWLKRIEVITGKFNGPFQAKDYNYYPFKDHDLGKTPVTLINVNSIIQKPLNLSTLNTGTHLIKGIAWSGAGRIREVYIKTNQEKNWSKAKLNQQVNHPYAWIYWSYEWTVHKRGEYRIQVKARDSRDRIQPDVPFWNRLGYGYNAVSEIKVQIE